MAELKYADGFADGVAYAVRVVAKKLNEAMQEPRRRPSDRAGRITALGMLLAELAPGLDYREVEAEK